MVNLFVGPIRLFEVQYRFERTLHRFCVLHDHLRMENHPKSHNMQTSKYKHLLVHAVWHVERSGTNSFGRWSHKFEKWCKVPMKLIILPEDIAHDHAYHSQLQFHIFQKKDLRSLSSDRDRTERESDVGFDASRHRF